MYQINFGIWSGVFAVPNEIVDKHIKLCSPLALRVLLILLRSARPMDSAELASTLANGISDIDDAILYWQTAGVILSLDSQSTDHPITEAPSSPPPEPAVLATPPKDDSLKIRTERFARMTRQDVLECSQRDDSIGFLIQCSQDVLGRILSNRETESIVGLYYNYALPVDVVLMLLGYCKSISKDSIAYIEKTGVSWVNREINTHERAEAELLSLANKNESQDAVRRIFGIHQRGISPKELEFYNAWTKDMKMTESLIQLAFERTVDTVGNINFAYTNGILADWHRKGIVTPEQAMREQKPSNNHSKENQSRGASYNLDQVDELLHGSIWEE